MHLFTLTNAGLPTFAYLLRDLNCCDGCINAAIAAVYSKLSNMQAQAGDLRLKFTQLRQCGRKEDSLRF